MPSTDNVQENNSRYIQDSVKEIRNVCSSYDNFIQEVSIKYQMVFTYIKDLREIFENQEPIEMICVEQLKEIVDHLSKHLEAKSDITIVSREIVRCREKIEERKRKLIEFIDNESFRFESNPSLGSNSAASLVMASLVYKMETYQDNMTILYVKSEEYRTYSDILEFNLKWFLSLINERIAHLKNN